MQPMVWPKSLVFAETMMERAPDIDEVEVGLGYGPLHSYRAPGEALTEVLNY